MERRVTIEYGDELLFSLGMSAEQFSEQAKFLLAAKLYELGKASSVQATRLCGKTCAELPDLSNQNWYTHKQPSAGGCPSRDRLRPQWLSP
jgi:Uncharacterised protein family (UPF0175)